MIKKNDNGKPVCPFCNSANTIKHGKTARGNERYLCKKTFIYNYETMFCRAKLLIPKIKFLEKGYPERVTIRALAVLAGAAKNTCLLWRRRMQECDEKIKKLSVLSGTVQIDGKYATVSEREMKAKDDGTQYKGISRNQVCIVQYGSPPWARGTMVS